MSSPCQDVGWEANETMLAAMLKELLDETMQHWFCSRSSSRVQKIAVQIVPLHQYTQSPSLGKFEYALRHILPLCIHCTRGYVWALQRALNQLWACSIYHENTVRLLEQCIAANDIARIVESFSNVMNNEFDSEHQQHLSTTERENRQHNIIIELLLRPNLFRMKIQNNALCDIVMCKRNDGSEFDLCARVSDACCKQYNRHGMSRRLRDKRHDDDDDDDDVDSSVHIDSVIDENSSWLLGNDDDDDDDDDGDDDDDDDGVAKIKQDECQLKLHNDVMILLPTVYTLCIHPSVAVRSWARTAVIRVGEVNDVRSFYASLALALDECYLILRFKRFIDQLYHVCNDDDEFLLYSPVQFWSGFTILLKSISSQIWSRIDSVFITNDALFVDGVIQHIVTSTTSSRVSAPSSSSSSLLLLSSSSSSSSSSSLPTSSPDTNALLLRSIIQCLHIFLQYSKHRIWSCSTFSPQLVFSSLQNLNMRFSPSNTSDMSVTCALQRVFLPFILSLVDFITKPDDDLNIYVITVLKILQNSIDEAFVLGATTAFVLRGSLAFRVLIDMVKAMYVVAKPCMLLTQTHWVFPLTRLVLLTNPDKQTTPFNSNVYNDLSGAACKLFASILLSDAHNINTMCRIAAKQDDDDEEEEDDDDDDDEDDNVANDNDDVSVCIRSLDVAMQQSFGEDWSTAILLADQVWSCLSVTNAIESVPVSLHVALINAFGVVSVYTQTELSGVRIAGGIYAERLSAFANVSLSFEHRYSTYLNRLVKCPLLAKSVCRLPYTLTRLVHALLHPNKDIYTPSGSLLRTCIGSSSLTVCVAHMVNLYTNDMLDVVHHSIKGLLRSHALDGRNSFKSLYRTFFWLHRIMLVSCTQPHNYDVANPLDATHNKQLIAQDECIASIDTTPQILADKLTVHVIRLLWEFVSLCIGGGYSKRSEPDFGATYSALFDLANDIWPRVRALPKTMTPLLAQCLAVQYTHCTDDVRRRWLDLIINILTVPSNSNEHCNTACSQLQKALAQNKEEIRKLFSPDLIHNASQRDALATLLPSSFILESVSSSCLQHLPSQSEHTQTIAVEAATTTPANNSNNIPLTINLISESDSSGGTNDDDDINDDDDDDDEDIARHNKIPVKSLRNQSAITPCVVTKLTPPKTGVNVASSRSRRSKLTSLRREFLKLQQQQQSLGNNDKETSKRVHARDIIAHSHYVAGNKHKIKRNAIPTQSLPLQSRQHLLEQILSWHPRCAPEKWMSTWSSRAPPSSSISTSANCHSISVFTSADDYQRHFGSLLLHECSANVYQELQYAMRHTQKYRMKLMRHTIDNDLCVNNVSQQHGDNGANTHMKHHHKHNASSDVIPSLRLHFRDAADNDECIHTLQFNVDLVCVWPAHSKTIDQVDDVPHNALFGLVRAGCNGSNSISVSVRADTLRSSGHGGTKRTVLPSDWILLRITQLTLALRHTKALRASASNTLCRVFREPNLLTPQSLLSIKDNDNNVCVDIATHTHTLQLNHDQLNVVCVCAHTKYSPLTLILGPPGSGKTKCIVGIVAAVLKRAKVESTAAAPTGWRAASTAMKIKSSASHVLVCAPSNAAVDQVTERLIQFMSSSSSSSANTVSIVRFGAGCNTTSLAHSVSLDVLAQPGEHHQQSIHEKSRTTKQLRLQMNEITRRLARDDDDDDELTQDEQIALRQQKHELSVQLAKNVRQQRDLRKTVRNNLKEKKIQILQDAHIVCSTLDSAGHSLLSNSVPHGFGTIVVDESTQSIEPSILIALTSVGAAVGCRVILVGDPCQLAATVVSDVANTNGLSISMFERCQTANSSLVLRLTQQYRMHPHICEWPSKEFYSGQLQSAGDLSNYVSPLHNQSSLCRPYSVLDVAFGEQKQCGTSVDNAMEAQLAVQLVHHITQCQPKVSIGVITPYQGQLSLIRIKANSIGLSHIDVRTVDSFQGQERDVIIFSAVRSTRDDGGRGSLGFVKQPQRLNVALTRARFVLIVLVNAKTVIQSNVWRSLIENAVQRKLLFSVPRDMSKIHHSPLHAVTAMSNIGSVSHPNKLHERNRKRKRYERIRAPPPSSSSSSCRRRARQRLSPSNKHSTAVTSSSSSSTTVPHSVVSLSNERIPSSSSSSFTRTRETHRPKRQTKRIAMHGSNQHRQHKETSRSTVSTSIPRTNSATAGRNKPLEQRKPTSNRGKSTSTARKSMNEILGDIGTTYKSHRSR